MFAWTNGLANTVDSRRNITYHDIIVKLIYLVHNQRCHVTVLTQCDPSFRWNWQCVKFSWGGFILSITMLKTRASKYMQQGNICFFRSPFTSILTIISKWISNYMPCKVRDEIIYPFLNFDGPSVEIWEWISNYTPHSIMDIYIRIHVSEGVPGVFHWRWDNGMSVTMPVKQPWSDGSNHALLTRNKRCNSLREFILLWEARYLIRFWITFHRYGYTLETGIFRNVNANALMPWRLVSPGHHNHVIDHVWYIEHCLSHKDSLKWSASFHLWVIVKQWICILVS